MSVATAKRTRKRRAKQADRRSYVFLKYQQDFLRDRSRNILVEKGGQVGFSWTGSYKMTEFSSLKTTRYDSFIASRDELQARLFGDYSKYWAKMLHGAAAEVQETVLIEDGRQIPASFLPFANGRKMWFLSSNPDAQAGKPGKRLWDEFALNRENRKLYGIGMARTEWSTGGVDIISTHRGTGNFFNELVEEIKHKGNPKKFSLHTIPITRAIEDGLLVKRKEAWRSENPEDERLAFSEDDYLQYLRDQCATEEDWQQEYMCQPADDESAFLSYDLIASCQYPGHEVWEKDLKDAKGDLYVGVDVGRLHDLTVIWVFERVGDVLYTRRIICLKKMAFRDQREELYKILRLPQVRRCCIDNTGLGMQFAEEAQSDFGKYKVEAVTFTNSVKEELAYPVRSAFEDRTIRIPDDKDLRADLRSIRKEQTKANNIRFTADQGKNGHADRFWALALAKHAVGQNSEPFVMVVG